MMDRIPANIQLALPSSPPASKPLYKKDAIARQRLFDLLDHGRQQPCVWVTAAAGYGKSTLMASYLNQKQEPRLWYALRSADSDLMFFFQHLTQTLKTQYPALDLPEISLINLFSPQAFGQAFFSALRATPVTLVLDDYHHLDADSPVHSALSSGLEQLETGRCLIASRAPPPPALTRLVANGVIDLVATDALRFTHEETGHLLSQYKLGTISDDIVQTLYNLSEGWVAGLILLIKQQQLGRLPSAAEGLVSGYFNHEVLSQFDTETRRFLMICALIPDITASQAAALTGKRDAGQRLEHAVSSCAFIKCLPNSPPNYRFHALFCDVLLNMGPDKLGIETLNNLKQQAAQLLIVQGKLDAAVELLVGLKDWTSLIALVEAQAEILLAQGRMHTLKTWIKAIPAEEAAKVIWLAFWDARCDLPFTPVEARQSLESVFKRFKKTNDNSGVYLTWSFIVESYFIERYEFGPLDHWQQVLTELYLDYALPNELSVRARVIYAQYIIIVSRTNSIDSKLDAEMIGLLYSQLPVDQKMAFGTMIIFRVARLDKGRKRCKKVQLIIRQLLASENVSPLDRYFWNISQVFYDYFFADYPLSLSNSLVEARDIGERHGFKILWRTYQLFECHAHCIEGRGNDAEQILDSLETVYCKTNIHDLCYLKMMRAYCHLVSGRLDTALDYSEQMIQLSPPVNPIERAHRGLAVAQIALGLGDRHKVLLSVAHVRKISRKIASTSLEFSARIILATYSTPHCPDQFL